MTYTIKNEYFLYRYNHKGFSLEIFNFSFFINIYYSLIGLYKTRKDGKIKTFIWKYFIDND